MIITPQSPEEIDRKAGTDYATRISISEANGFSDPEYRAFLAGAKHGREQKDKEWLTMLHNKGAENLANDLEMLRIKLRHAKETAKQAEIIRELVIALSMAKEEITAATYLHFKSIDKEYLAANHLVSFGPKYIDEALAKLAELRSGK